MVFVFCINFITLQLSTLRTDSLLTLITSSFRLASMNQNFDFRKKIEIYFFTTLTFIAIVYGIWRAYPLVAGPSININYPHDGDIVSSTTFQVSGKVSRVKNILLQGRPIPIDKKGNFTEILVAQFPYTPIVITATDFYDKTVTKTLNVVPK